MNRSDAPSKKSVPFGINGPREAILDTTPAGNNQASYDSGFPPITMILKSAGGLPPKGEDFNQILYELALNARWNQAGAGYQFDSTFSTGISGYPIGAIVQNSTGDGTWINTTDGNTNNPEVATATPLTGWLPLDSNGFTTKSGLTNANVTLTTLEASRERIVLSGTLTANINLIVPAWRKKWTVVNNCTGSFSVTIKTTSGTGIVVPQGLATSVLGDGTNIVQDSQSVQTASPGSSNTQIANTAFVAAALTAFLPKRSFANKDYIRIPDVAGGLIIQWGLESVPPSSSTVFSLPTTFPNSGLAAVASAADSTTTTNYRASAGSVSPFPTASQIRLTNTFPSNAINVFYIAIGY
ncbi:gp53-like domain-containing protein [Enterobacter roggenkampii]|uniref:gp53-like domain-containing protein n=1 Tax=Enterobacter roggenkampii TaxID=1812935 RepID=UPI000FCC1610|nr:hypothetical protein [Enterobacter roggenkampii]